MCGSRVKQDPSMRTKHHQHTFHHCTQNSHLRLHQSKDSTLRLRPSRQSLLHPHQWWWQSNTLGLDRRHLQGLPSNQRTSSPLMTRLPTTPVVRAIMPNMALLLTLEAYCRTLLMGPLSCLLDLWPGWRVALLPPPRTANTSSIRPPRNLPLLLLRNPLSMIRARSMTS